MLKFNSVGNAIKSLGDIGNALSSPAKNTIPGMPTKRINIVGITDKLKGKKKKKNEVAVEAIDALGNV
jgi:hypothetical protein